jgi:small subunit ribosomal protein S6
VSAITYETVFIAEPEVSNDQVDQLINKIKQMVATHQGTLTGEDRWGRRRLAYPIQGHREGFYAVLNFSAEGGVVTDLEHLFNVTDAVLRHLTVRIVKKNKTFAPRRERSAGRADSAHSGGRFAGGPRSRADVSPSPKPAVADPSAPPAARLAEGGAAGNPATAPQHPEGGTTQ